MALSDAVIATIRSTQIEPRVTFSVGEYAYDSRKRFQLRSSGFQHYVLGSYCCYANMLDPEADCGCDKPDRLEMLAALGLVQLIETRHIAVDLKDLR